MAICRRCGTKYSILNGVIGTGLCIPCYEAGDSSPVDQGTKNPAESAVQVASSVEDQESVADKAKDPGESTVQAVSLVEESDTDRIVAAIRSLENEVRQVRAACEKTKWAARSIAFTVFLLLLCSAYWYDRIISWLHIALR